MFVHAVSLTLIFAFENRSYLGEFEAEFKKALGREPGAQGILFDEKTESRKSRDTVPLSTQSTADCSSVSKLPYVFPQTLRRRSSMV
jgi:hypothetical protein